ncbi:amidohydrolase [Candidatus Woesearchaeota archaeon]|nr:amidohydrolase [Candidatus Woesearchaeota archaeon]
MLEKKEYDRLSERILKWVPDKIIDAHVHTGSRAGNVPPEKSKPHPISYRLFRNKTLTVFPDIFDPVFPDSKIKMIGFPLPLPFKEINPLIWNKRLMIKEMKKGIYGVMYGLNNITELNKTIKVAKKNGLKFYGIKFHPRMVSEKIRSEVLLKEVVQEKTLEFIENNDLTMILELSHGYNEEDIKFVNMIGENYNIRTVIPHLGFNYRGFVMRSDDYKKSLEGSPEWFDKELKKIKECKNVYFDASMVIDKRAVEAAMDLFGETKIMYGTDYPFGFSSKIIENRPDDDALAKDLRALMNKRLKNPWRYYYNVYLQVLAFINAEKSLNLDLKEKVMWKNSKRIYKLS